MLTRRIVACLDVCDGRVVKGINFDSLRAAGSPASLARRYYEEQADELVVLDVTATAERRIARARTVAEVAREIFIPLIVGGGIGSLLDAAAVFEAGADKVAVNTAAVEDPTLVTRIAHQYGSQAVIVAIDAKRVENGFEVYTHSGRRPAGRGAVDWAREAADRGAGELLVTSIDRDGTRTGFDTVLTAALAAAVDIPVIASGGAGEPEHFVEVFTDGHADAALAASIFHFAEHGIVSLKQFLAARGVPVRC